MKERRFYRRIRSILTACIVSAVFAAVPVTAGASSGGELEAVESAEASTIQLMKTEGDVVISNGSGRSLSVIENMKLYNGYRTGTQEASYAWISLDSEKLTKLDAVSEAEIRKSGKKLEIMLNSGNLFFDVTKPLEDDETLNIRTSTMVMGIRGTSGWVKVIDRWRTRVYILEGTVVCYVSDPVTGQTKSTTLSGGETADFVVYEKDQNGERCDIIRQGFSEDDIDGFVLAELAQDPDLCRKIKDASGLNAESAAKEAGQRLSEDEKRMGELLSEIQDKYAAQENHISKDPVWIGGGASRGTAENGNGEQDSMQPGGTALDEAGNAPGAGTSPGGAAVPDGGAAVPGDGTAVPEGTDSGGAPASSGGSSSGSSGSGSQTDNGGNTNTDTSTDTNTNTDPVVTPTVTETVSIDDVTAESLQELLNDPNVKEVVLRPGGTSEVPDRFIEMDQGDVLVVPAGKTLTLDGTALEIKDGSLVQVDGTLNVDNSSDVYVYGTLNVDGDLVNEGYISVNGGVEVPP